MMQTSDIEFLEAQIKSKRREMYSIAFSLGFTHPRVVACSQDLDTLLNRVQGIQCAS